MCLDAALPDRCAGIEFDAITPDEKGNTFFFKGLGCLFFFTNNDFIFGVVIIYYPLEPGFGSNIREPKSTKRCGFNTKARNTTIGGTDTGNRWNTFTSQQKHMEITRLTCSRHIYNSYMSTRKLGDSLVNAVLTETQH